MILKNIHNWFLSLAIVASVVSFSGFTAESPVKKPVHTELIKTNKPITKSAVYYYGAILKLEQPTNFSFKTLLKYYNLRTNIQFISTDLKVRTYLAYVTLKPIEQIVVKDNYSHIFIG